MTKTVEPQRMPLPGVPVWPLSVAAYRTLGEAGLIPPNTELLYGFVYRKMSKSPLHSALAMRVARLLQAAVGPGRVVRVEQPVTCGDSEPEPDVAVVAGDERDFWHEHPRTAELVVEICVTSVEYDRSKLPAYAAAGIKECWLVLAGHKQIEVHRSPENGKFDTTSTRGPGGVLTSHAVPEFSLDLEALFSE